MEKLPILNIWKQVTSISSTASNSELKKNFLLNLVYMSEFFLEITGVDTNLIQRFQTLLATISSGERIDAPKFKSNATIHYNVKLYECPTTLHKLLIQGCEIIVKSSSPVGKLSEGVQESVNKAIRKTRENKCQKRITWENYRWHVSWAANCVRSGSSEF